jgi:hypothetical protein
MVESNRGWNSPKAGTAKNVEPLLDWRDLIEEGGSAFHGLLWRKDKIGIDLGHFVCCSVGCLS